MLRSLFIGYVAADRPGGNRPRYTVQVVEDKGRLSICGTLYTPGRRDIDAGGQHREDPAAIVEWAPGWDAKRYARLVEIWETWHLNDMQAGCEHQRAAGWNKRPIDPSKPLDTYGRHFEGQRHDSWNMLTWVREGEHPEGLMCRPCPECGYKYGTAWLTMDVPADVLAELAAMPDGGGKRHPFEMAHA